jgi:hypothetical protein
MAELTLIDSAIYWQLEEGNMVNAKRAEPL